MPENKIGRTKKVLLTGVFGPYGVDDAYGRKENIMELFHNQVTKAQGVGSFRFHHRSFGLYFLAENIDAEVTVLDFPSEARFRQELAKTNWDIVGISFITPNFDKAKKMACVIRELRPETEIIVGGHGAAIEGVEDLINCDHVVKGEGIRWLRRHLGQDPGAPIRHPALPSAERQSIFGVPLLGKRASLLVPGVGCVNGCNFCATSHFFSKTYTPFLSTGKQLFETARAIADERGTDAFFVMDENFLKDRQRALDLIAEMEKHQRFFRFHLFSSAEAILAFGLDNMVRLGATLVWIGFESRSRQSAFAKNVGVDSKALVEGLRARGVSVLGSGILCMEHHTPDNMQDDIDFLVDLETDFVQFMLLTPMPVTGLYRDLQRRNLLREDLSYQEWHGQKKLAFRHPAFTDEEAEAWLTRAFRQDYERNSSSMLRLIDTSLRGYEHLAALENRDPCLEKRKGQFATQARLYALILHSIARNAVNEEERRRAVELDQRARQHFGRNWWEHVAAAATSSFTALWKLRLRLHGDQIQPKTIVTHYKAERNILAGRTSTSEGREQTINSETMRPAAAAVTMTE